MTSNWSYSYYAKNVIGDAIEDVMVNDALGTISPSDSTGTDEEMETGDAKWANFPTQED